MVPRRLTPNGGTMKRQTTKVQCLLPPLDAQAAAWKRVLPRLESGNHQGAANKGETLLLPDWRRLGPSYGHAALALISAAQSELNMKIWKPVAAMSHDRIILRPATAAALDALPSYDQHFRLCPVQCGQAKSGRSVYGVVRSIRSPEFLLGPLETLSILVVQPDMIRSYEDLSIDSAGAHALLPNGKKRYFSFFWAEDRINVNIATNDRIASPYHGIATGLTPSLG